MMTNGRKAVVLMLAILVRSLVLSEVPITMKDQNQKEVAVFTAEVIRITPMKSFKGRSVVVNPDPRWVVQLKIVSRVPEGEVHPPDIFAIHSPTQLLQEPADKAIGLFYQFTLSQWRQAEGKAVYTLSAVPAKH